jgi:beta-phosphoglucomutase
LPDSFISHFPSAVLWDMDGVLVDTGDLHYQSWAKAMAEYNLTLSKERFLQFFGRSPQDTFNGLMADVDLPIALRIQERKEKLFYQSASGNVRIMPGVLTWLIKFSNHCPQAVASSAPIEIIEYLLDTMEIRNFFKVLISGANLESSKPDPAIFITVANKLGISPSKCLVIEDSPSGIEAAKRAGIPVIALCTSFSKEKLIGANLIIENLNMLSERDLILLY